MATTHEIGHISILGSTTTPSPSAEFALPATSVNTVNGPTKLDGVVNSSNLLDSSTIWVDLSSNFDLDFLLPTGATTTTGQYKKKSDSTYTSLTSITGGFRKSFSSTDAELSLDFKFIYTPNQRTEQTVVITVRVRSGVGPYGLGL